MRKHRSVRRRLDVRGNNGPFAESGPPETDLDDRERRTREKGGEAVGLATSGGCDAAFHAAYEGRSAARECLALLCALWRSLYRLRIVLLAAGIVAVLGGNMVGQIRLNQRHGAFFDALGGLFSPPFDAACFVAALVAPTV